VSVDRNGITIVGNIEGLVSVVARGIEVKLPEGTRTTVVPGQSPGQPEPDTTLPAQRAPASLPAVTPEPTPTPTPAPDIAKTSISKTCDHQTAYPGDNITYTYRVSNEGDVPLSNITVKDDKAGQAAFISGDDDSDGILDKGETWIFNAIYTVKDGETGKLTNKATVTGTGPGNQEAVASATATVNVIDIVVKITSLKAGDTVGRTLIVSGTVNDPSITQGVIAVNDSSRNISVTNGQYSITVDLEDGVNVITVTVTKAGGITASDTKTLEPLK
jgi:uncharacterized repeat protein (TIGR01451 family)